jgi:hypothetical protein
MGHWYTKPIQSKECRLMGIMNPEHTIIWPSTWQELIDYLSQMHPEARHIQYCIFLTALGEKRIYNEASYAAMIPALKIYDGNIHVYSVFLWQVILPNQETLWLSTHLDLKVLPSWEKIKHT